MQGDPVEVRAAGPDDAEAIGLIAVRAWQHAYRGVMPDDYLDSLRAEDRAEFFRPGLEHPRPDHGILVADGPAGVCGFTTFGPAPEHSVGPDPTAEVFALNVDPGSWGRGIGAALVRAAEASLADWGHTDAVLWTGPGNRRARRLYESLGWAHDGATRRVDLFGVTIDEVRYRTRLGTAANNVEP